MDVMFDALAESRVLADFARAFRDATGLSLALARRGKPQRPVVLRRAENPFCALIAMTASSRARCLDTQQQLQRRLERRLAPQQICCFAGLTELAVPVVVGGQHVATLLGGQVFQRRPGRWQLARLARHLRTCGVPAPLNRAKQAYVHTPVVSGKRLRGAVRLLTVFATQLAESVSRLLLLTRTDDPPAVAQAKSFVRAHAGGRVTLDEVAEHVHLSRYYFCRTFKAATGMTLTEFVARARMENAKRLLANPFLSVGEVAGQVGFNSISQFNRAFRRYVGGSPTAYRSALQREVTR